MTDYRDIDTDDCENGITRPSIMATFDDCDHHVPHDDVLTCDGCGAPLCPECRVYLTVKPGEYRCQYCVSADREEYE